MRNEFSKAWRSPSHCGIELFHAYFHKFSFAKHWHDELAIGIFLSGVEKLDYRGETVTIPQGTLAALNPGEIHTGFSGSDSGWYYRMFYFDTALIEETLREHTLLNQTPVPFLKGPLLDDPELFQLLYKLHSSLEMNALSLSTDSLLTLAISQLFARHGDQKIYPKSSSNKQGVLKARAYLQENWQRNVTLDELCQLTGMSRYQLIRSFNAQFGVPPHQFLILLKTQRARALFRTGAQVAEVAIDCGFFDQSHLSRNFKRAFGITPARYLKSAQRNFVQEPSFYSL
ncbi:AraC family ligand binding domain-containing protein [Microbulbifer sp. ZKSA002]|uniref:AraC family ligand binding domain-containing protein n=1 Tax=Microbulbifer sp. ZKSA002 TaxID=3243388 RepID=UPI004039764F